MTSQPRITASPDYQSDIDESISFYVVTADSARAAAGLQAAAARLFRVGDNGVEFPDDEAMYAAEDSVNTPNYVSDVEARSDGACVDLDTKGETPAPASHPHRGTAPGRRHRGSRATDDASRWLTRAAADLVGSR